MSVSVPAAYCWRPEKTTDCMYGIARAVRCSALLQPTLIGERPLLLLAASERRSLTHAGQIYVDAVNAQSTARTQRISRRLRRQRARGAGEQAPTATSHVSRLLPPPDQILRRCLYAPQDRVPQRSCLQQIDGIFHRENRRLRWHEASKPSNHSVLLSEHVYLAAVI